VRGADPVVGEQNKGLAMMLGVVAVVFIVLLVVGYAVGDV
jgi:hypothetical protein